MQNDEIRKVIQKKIGERPDSDSNYYLRLVMIGCVFIIAPITMIVEFIGETSAAGIHQLVLTLFGLLGLVLVGHRLRIYIWDKQFREYWEKLKDQ
jgi:hypothetical protein